MMTLKLLSSQLQAGSAVKPRSEMHFHKETQEDPIREFGLWLLWTGISPEAKLPVSSIGIYTDFT